MNKLHAAGERLEALLRERGIEKYAIRVTEKETEEFNAENGAFTLYRTLFEKNAFLSVFTEDRMGMAGGNDLSEDGLAALVDSAIASAKAAAPDAAHDLAPCQREEIFHTGCHEADMEGFFRRFRELLDTVEKDYPLILIMLAVASHVKQHTYYKNSNGTVFEKYGGYYHVMLEYSANNGVLTTSADFVSLSFTDLDRPLISRGEVRKRLEDTVAQLHLTPLGDKFTGTVIFTPDCLHSFLSHLLSITVTDSVVLDGTSPWLERVGERVASEKLTLTLPANHPEMPDPQCFNGDGFRTEDVTVLERGVLQSRLISLYVSNKTGKPAAKADGEFFAVEPGDVSLEEMIRRVKRGLIVGYFSGGDPEVSGEFSGVAKNSFYVENGKVLGAVVETMINGNLLSLFRDVSAISKERVHTDGGLLPYLAAENVVISGK